MKSNEVKAKILKEDHLIMLVGISTKSSNYNEMPTITFYFVDTENNIWKHCQTVQPGTKNEFQIRRFLCNLGLDIKDHKPLDFYNDFNTVVLSQHRNIKDTMLGKALGRVYKGVIVKRRMLWKKKNNKGDLVDVRKTFLNLDHVNSILYYKQDALVERFKNNSKNYDWWKEKMFERGDMREFDYKSCGVDIKCSWDLTEKELFGCTKSKRKR